MAKPKTITGKGMGWFKQPIRHRKAKLYGKAGGIYKTDKVSKRLQTILQKNPSYKNLTFKELKNKGIFLKYQSDNDKDGTKNIYDCQPLNPKKQDLKKAIKKGKEKTMGLLKKGFKKAKEIAKKELPKIKELTKKAREKVEEILEEHKEKRREAVEKAIREATKGRLIPEEEKVKEEITEKILEPTPTEMEVTGIGRIPEGTEEEYITKFFQEQKPIFDPEESRRIAEKTLKAMEETKHRQLEQLKDIKVEEFSDEELKKIATRLGTGTFGRGNKYLNEIKRRIRQRERIKTDLEIELMIAQKEAKRRMDEEIKRGVKGGGYIWDDWFK